MSYILFRSRFNKAQNLSSTTASLPVFSVEGVAHLDYKGALEVDGSEYDIENQDYRKSAWSFDTVTTPSADVEKPIELPLDDRGHLTSHLSFCDTASHISVPPYDGEESHLFTTAVPSITELSEHIIESPRHSLRIDAAVPIIAIPQRVQIFVHKSTSREYF